MALIDVPGFVTELKDHASDHGFHVHDERHFVETYSMRQAWEVDLHPERACGGPLDLHLAVELDPRTLITFEDAVIALGDDDDDIDPPRGHSIPLVFTWGLPPLPNCPDLLHLGIEISSVGGTELPLEISAIDSTAAVTDAPIRTLSIAAKIELDLADLFLRREDLCEVFDKSHAVSEFLLDRAPVWLDEVF